MGGDKTSHGIGKIPIYSPPLDRFRIEQEPKIWEEKSLTAARIFSPRGQCIILNTIFFGIRTVRNDIEIEYPVTNDFVENFRNFFSTSFCGALLEFSMWMERYSVLHQIHHSLEHNPDCVSEYFHSWHLRKWLYLKNKNEKAKNYFKSAWHLFSNTTTTTSTTTTTTTIYNNNKKKK